MRTCFYLENKILKLKCLRTTTILSSDIVYQTFLHSFLRESKSSLIITCKTTNSLSLLTQQQYAKTFPLTFLPQHSGPFPEAPAQPFCLKSQLLNTSICFVSFISGSLICLGWSVFHFKGIFQHLLSPGRPLTLMVSPGRAGGSGEGAC